MKVGDIMTRDLVTAGRDTGVDAIARLMLERHIVDSKRRLGEF